MKNKDFQKPELGDFSNLGPINLDHGEAKTPFIKKIAEEHGIPCVDVALADFDKNLSPFAPDRNEPVCIFLDEITIK